MLKIVSGYLTKEHLFNFIRGELQHSEKMEDLRALIEILSFGDSLDFTGSFLRPETNGKSLKLFYELSPFGPIKEIPKPDSIVSLLSNLPVEVQASIDPFADLNSDSDSEPLLPSASSGEEDLYEYVMDYDEY